MNDLYSVFMVSGTDGWAVGSWGRILHFGAAPPPLGRPPGAPPVGGSIVQVNKLALSASYLSLLLLIGAAAVAVAAKRKREA